MIAGLIEEFFAIVFIIIALWIAGMGALSLYSKFRSINNKTKDK